jgi:hypothetical protein
MPDERHGDDGVHNPDDVEAEDDRETAVKVAS